MTQTATPPTARTPIVVTSRGHAAPARQPALPAPTAPTAPTAPNAPNAPIARGARPTRKGRIAVAGTAMALSWLYANTALAQGGPSCAAHSAATPPTIVELYTSEGCSSCPPADRWLSSLKGRPGVLALAFHVDYWDRLGWVDRFASPAYTQRQSQLQRSSGAGFSYTPQVLVDGADWRRWPDLPAGRRTSSPIDVALSREAQTLVAQITPNAATPAQLSAYWFSLEDDQRSAVKAGENSGATLQHDHVVRDYRPVAAWPGSTAQTLRLEASPTAAPATAQAGAGGKKRSGLVVTDARTGRPIQAVVLGC